MVKLKIQPHFYRERNKNLFVRVLFLISASICAFALLVDIAFCV